MNHLHIKHWSTQGIFPAQHGYQPVTDLDVAMFCTLHVRQRWQKTAVDALQQSWLVVLTILKNMKVNGKDYPIYEMENKKCLKPPTRKCLACFLCTPLTHMDVQPRRRGLSTRHL